MKNSTTISPPWETYYKELTALFIQDPYIQMDCTKSDDGNPTIHFYVYKRNKADALKRILPKMRQFGTVVVTIEVICVEDLGTDTEALFETAFKDNPVYSHIEQDGDFIHLVFKPKIAQYFNDNMRDVNGFTSILYQDIALEVFKDFPGVFFSTDRLRDANDDIEGWP